MTERLSIIFDHIPKCKVFADIGCDHGYIALNMLTKGKCERAIVSDISAKCLSKAEALLSNFIEQGLAQSVVSNGFEKVGDHDVALIAGMGGEEICSILLNAKKLSQTLVLQPMKNCDKVRKQVLELGYKFVSDSMFFSAGKFYDLMVLVKGEDCLTDEEIAFGRDNLAGHNEHFKRKIRLDIQKLNQHLSNDKLSVSVREKMLEELEKLKKYV